MNKIMRGLRLLTALGLLIVTRTPAQTMTSDLVGGETLSASESVAEGNGFAGQNVAACNDPSNGIAYVGGSCASAWGGGDIGAQINAAYGGLSSPGGKIMVIPQTTGQCYEFATPILFTTASKYVLLEGAGAESQIGVSSNGACLNYTPATRTTAITMDYVPSNGGGATRNHGMRNLRLINRQCNTMGGCSSLATGISCTSKNAGCQTATFDHTSIIGFGTGLDLVKPTTGNRASWGVLLFGGACSYNTTCLSIASGIEMVKMEDEVVLGNATGVTMGSSSDFVIAKSHCDSNTIICVVSTGGHVSATDNHYENQGVNNMAMINAGLTLDVKGGFALDDCASAAACGGVTPKYWFNAPLLTSTGLSIFSAGRIPAHVFVYASAAMVTGFINVSNVIPHDNVISTVSGNAIFNQLGAGPATLEAAMFMADSGVAATFTCAEVGAITGWGSGGRCSNPQGGNQRFQFTMAASGQGITANPTVQITLAVPWPSAPLYLCKMVGGSAAPAPITGEQSKISTSTIGPLMYQGTPSSGQTVIISCLGM